MSVMVRGRGDGYARLATARKTHYCSAIREHNSGCLCTINPGAPYLRSVLFPGELGNTVPMTHKLCAPCAEYYGYPVTSEVSA